MSNDYDNTYILLYMYIPYKFCIYSIYNGAGLYILYRHISTGLGPYSPSMYISPEVCLRLWFKSAKYQLLG